MKNIKNKGIISLILALTMIFNLLTTLTTFAIENKSKVYTYDNYEICYDIVNEWIDGETTNRQQINVTITNTGNELIENWKLYYDFNGIIEGIWNAQILTDNNENYISNMGYNVVIYPNSAVSFGYIIVGTGEIPDYIGMTPSNTNQNEDLDDWAYGQIYFKDIQSDDEIDYDNGVCFVKNQLLLTGCYGVAYDEIKSLITDLNANIVGYIELTNDYQIEFNYDISVYDLYHLISELEQKQIIESACLNELSEDEVEYFPNDTKIQSKIIDDKDVTIHEQNWSLYAINAPKAWVYLKNEEIKTTNVKMGLIDGLFYKNHSDLNFKSTYNNKTPEVNNAYGAHGTHVAGIMAAKFDNKTGIAGVNPNNTLYGFSMHGKSNEKLAKMNNSIIEWKCALALLIGNHNRVINISMGNGTNSDKATEVMGDFLNKLLDKNKGYDFDFLIVKSAGNTYTDAFENHFLTKITTKPAYDHIIVVGAVGLKDNPLKNSNGDILLDKDCYDYLLMLNTKGDLIMGSNYGSRVDIVAPGKDIYSTAVGENAYKPMSGTSMAAPHVSGVAGMIYSVNPELRGDQVKAIIKETAGIGIKCLADNKEYKLLDAQKAVAKALGEDGDYEETEEVILMGSLTVKDKMISNQKIDIYLVDKNNKIGVKPTETIETDNYGGFETVLERGKYVLKSKLYDGVNFTTVRTNVDLTNENMFTFTKFWDATSSKIKSVATGSPIKDVTVSTIESDEEYIVISNTDGSFSTDLSDGVYNITFTKNGYIDLMITIEMIDGIMYDMQGNVLEEIILTPIEITLTGKVEIYNRTTEELRPAINTTVGIYSDGSLVTNAITNSEGIYEVSIANQGDYIVKFSEEKQTPIYLYNGTYTVDVVFEEEELEEDDKDNTDDKDKDKDNEVIDDNPKNPWTENFDNNANSEITISTDELDGGGAWIAVADNDGVTPKYYLNFYFDDYENTSKLKYVPTYATNKKRLCVDVYNSSGNLLRRYNETCMVMNSMGFDELHDLYKYREIDAKPSYSVAWGYNGGSKSVTEMFTITYNAKGFYTYGTYTITYDDYENYNRSEDVSVGGSEWKMFGISGKTLSVSNASPF